MDDFDRLAKAVHDHRTIFRGESMPYSSEAERIANGELAVQQHIEALARLMREGGSVAEFLRETLHLHGGSRFGWPFELEKAVYDPDGQISGKDCWAIVRHCSGRPSAPWPGTASDIETSAIALNKSAKPKGWPKGSAPSISQQDKARRRSPENDARLKNKIESVLAAGRSLQKRRPKSGPDQLADEMRKEDRRGYSTETVSQILSGRYKPMKRFDLRGIL